MPTAARQARRQQSHERILDAGARALSRSGVAGVGVADVMRQAGLTHGGFYAHFESRDALLVEALEHAGRRGMERLRGRIAARAPSGASPLRILLEEYLSEAHMAAEEGCMVAALGSEMARTEDLLRTASAGRVRALVAVVRDALAPATPDDAATVIAATMAGALQMARVLGAEHGGPAILAACRTALLAQYDTDH
jgi:AcrR family transcriptional regulator